MKAKLQINFIYHNFYRIDKINKPGLINLNDFLIEWDEMRKNTITERFLMRNLKIGSYPILKNQDLKNKYTHKNTIESYLDFYSVSFCKPLGIIYEVILKIFFTQNRSS